MHVCVGHVLLYILYNRWENSICAFLCQLHLLQISVLMVCWEQIVRGKKWHHFVLAMMGVETHFSVLTEYVTVFIVLTREDKKNWLIFNICLWPQELQTHRKSFYIFTLMLRQIECSSVPHPFSFFYLLFVQASKWCALLHLAHHKQLLKIMRQPFSVPVAWKQSTSHGGPWAETEVESNGMQKLISKCTWWPFVVFGGTVIPASCRIVSVLFTLIIPWPYSSSLQAIKGVMRHLSNFFTELVGSMLCIKWSITMEPLPSFV